MATSRAQPAKLDLPVLAFASQAAFERWLARHHGRSTGLWLKFAKKASGIPSVSCAEAVEAALCHGWIDGQVRTLDDRYYLQRFTPRRPRSRWSRINCGKAAGLIARGKMKPAGLRQVEAAKADGRWEAAYGPSRPGAAAVPQDFRRALAASKRAGKTFATLNGWNRYVVLYWISDAKKPQTRARRIEHVVERLAEGTRVFR